MPKKPTKAVMNNIEANLIAVTLGFGITTATAMNATNETNNMTMFIANNADFI